MLWLLIVLFITAVGAAITRHKVKETSPTNNWDWALGMIITMGVAWVAIIVLGGLSVFWDRETKTIETTQSIVALADGPGDRLSGTFVFGSGSLTSTAEEVYRYAYQNGEDRIVARISSADAGNIWFRESTAPKVTVYREQGRRVAKPWIPEWLVATSWLESDWSDTDKKPDYRFYVPAGTIDADFSIDMS